MNEGENRTLTKCEANIFSDIEADIRGLMRKCGELSHGFKESQKQWESDTKKMLLDFIEVVDDFENKFKNIEARIDSADQQTKIWVNNFRTVYNLLRRSLKTAGVMPIETVIGERANPFWHNVVEIICDPDKEDEVIIEELKKGYLWNGKLLRTAEVKAINNKTGPIA